MLAQPKLLTWSATKSRIFNQLQYTAKLQQETPSNSSRIFSLTSRVPQFPLFSSHVSMVGIDCDEPLLVCRLLPSISSIHDCKHSPIIVRSTKMIRRIKWKICSLPRYSTTILETLDPWSTSISPRWIQVIFDGLSSKAALVDPDLRCITLGNI